MNREMKMREFSRFSNFVSDAFRPATAGGWIHSCSDQGFETDLLSNKRKISFSFSRVSLSGEHVKDDLVPILARRNMRRIRASLGFSIPAGDRTNCTRGIQVVTDRNRITCPFIDFLSQRRFFSNRIYDPYAKGGSEAPCTSTHAWEIQDANPRRKCIDSR